MPIDCLLCCINQVEVAHKPTTLVALGTFPWAFRAPSALFKEQTNIYLLSCYRHLCNLHGLIFGDYPLVLFLVQWFLLFSFLLLLSIAIFQLWRLSNFGGEQEQHIAEFFICISEHEAKRRLCGLRRRRKEGRKTEAAAQRTAVSDLNFWAKQLKNVGQLGEGQVLVAAQWQ